jgi:hypothetical protein
MKKFQFLLLDAGPVIKLFEIGLWEKFIEQCDVTISQVVANQAKWASRESEDIKIDLQFYERQGHIKFIDLEPRTVANFHNKFDLIYQADIHDGEKETLAFLCDSSDKWLVCAADKAVFRVLGTLGKGEQGISLEEILNQIGLSRPLEWKYTKRFREKYTREGEIDSIQDKSLV